jgi:HSP20 family protein
MVSRRWPESFQAMTSPFAEQGFRMEQFVDDDGALVIRGELPGLDPDEDVTIVVEGDHLKISGSREERSEETTDRSFRTEFHYGSFARSVALPSGARTDDITAAYTNGILEVRVPIDEESAAVTTIPIATAD